jgi:hypothetical protein
VDQGRAGDARARELGGTRFDGVGVQIDAGELSRDSVARGAEGSQPSGGAQEKGRVAAARVEGRRASVIDRPRDSEVSELGRRVERAEVFPASAAEPLA